MGQGDSKLHGAHVKSAPDVRDWYLIIFEYSDWQDRGSLLSICRKWRQYAKDPNFFRFMCTRLAHEHGVYVPPVLPTADSWRSMFLDLFKLKSIWKYTPAPVDVHENHGNTQVGERFKISVYARFRPATDLKGNVLEVDDNHKDVQVTLPLHQRLQMIKMSHKLKSNREALKVLTSEGGWFQAKWTELENKENQGGENDSAINPAAFYSKQKIPLITVKKPDEKMVASIQNLDPITGRVTMIAPDVGLREFTYDGVLPPMVSQKYMYDTTMRRLVTDFINGFNATAVVYGQTGSGKTYSMFGKDDASIYGRDEAGRGIVPRACEEIFQAIQKRQEMNNIHTQLSISYVEIYGDHVSDLLQYGARCGHSQVASQRYVLNGASEKVVHNMADVMTYLKMGEIQKRRAATAMNERSSRAHSLFIVTMKQSRFDPTAAAVTPSATGEVTLTSRLFLADLGGSEQVKKSQVEAGVHRVGAEQHFSLGFELGTHMREAVYINLGLLALKKCIESLNNRALYTPYQDSKLTMLLSQGLGGNSKTSIIICGNMDSTHASETVATLRFGERCAMIENTARNNATMLAAVLADIDAQIAALEAAILQKERWVVGEEKRVDVNAEANTVEAAVGGVESKKVIELVGAESERQQLEQLLIRRARFTGAKPLDEMEDESAVAGGAGSGRRRRPIVGFGKKAALFGVGSGFDAAQDSVADNARFIEGAVDLEELPAVLRAKGVVNWKTGDALAADAEALAKKAAKVKRNRLAYSGISA